MKYMVMAILLLASAVACYVIYRVANESDGIRALCNDGSISKSKINKGTCSHHGGVKHWIKDIGGASLNENQVN